MSAALSTRVGMLAVVTLLALATSACAECAWVQGIRTLACFLDTVDPCGPKGQ